VGSRANIKVIVLVFLSGECKPVRKGGCTAGYGGPGRSLGAWNGHARTRTRTAACILSMGADTQARGPAEICIGSISRLQEAYSGLKRHR
jgi:hypothetical protein